MMSARRARYTNIGLHLGEHIVTAVQLRRSGLAWEAAARLRYRRLEPGVDHFSAQEAQRLQQILRLKGFWGQAVSLCAPDRGTKSCLIALPSPPPPNPAGYLNDEFARIHGLPDGGFEIAAWSAHTSAHGSPPEIFTVGCAHAAIEPTLDQLETAGLRVDRMDATPSALSAYAQQSRPDRHDAAQIAAILDIQTTQTTLTLSRQDAAFYHSAMPCGGLHAMMDQAMRDNASDALRGIYLDWLLDPPQAPAAEECRQLQRFDQTLGKVAEDLAATVEMDLRRAKNYIGQMDTQYRLAGLVITGHAAQLRPHFLEHLRRRIVSLPTAAWSPGDAYASAVGTLLPECGPQPTLAFAPPPATPAPPAPPAPPTPKSEAA